MNVLIFTNLFPNASHPNHGTFVYQKAVRLVRRGHRVQVVAPIPFFPRHLGMPRFLRRRAPFSQWEAMRSVPRQEWLGGILVHHPRYWLMPTLSMPVHGLLMFLGSALLASELHKRSKFDCIDAHYVYPDGFAAVLLGRLLKMPVVVTAHGSDICLYPSSRILRPMIRWTLSRAAQIISVCQALKDIMVDRLAISASRIEVIHNGVDICDFHPLDRAEVRRRLGVPLGAKIALSVGALVPSKGQRLLIPAVRTVAEEYPGFRLYILGDGRLRTELQKLIVNLGLNECVFLIGEVENSRLSEWYNAADVTCLTSSREGLACVLLESLACGTPVVATDVGGTREIVTSGRLGLLVDQRIDAIARGLTTVLNTKWDTASLVQHAATRTWDDATAKVTQLLESVARPWSQQHRFATTGRQAAKAIGE